MRPVKQSWILAGGLLSAIAASLCCIGPMAVLALGLGSFAAVGWFESWRPVFLGVTATLLALAWGLALRARRVECAEVGTCASTRTKRWPLALLGICTLAVAGIALFPTVARTAADGSPLILTATKDSPVLRVRIPSMDCAACATGIQGTLRAVPGVRTAAVRYATKEAEIAYDPAVISPAALIARIDATGFKAEPLK